MTDLSQKKKERERKIQGGILGSEKPRSISNQDNCHVPSAGFSLPSLALWPHIQIQSQKNSPFSVKTYCASIYKILGE